MYEIFIYICKDKRVYMKKIRTLAAIMVAILCAGSAYAKTNEEVRIHLMGDSTCAPKDLSMGNPERGWGMMIGNYFDKQTTVLNHAVNGRSTRLIRLNGEWEKIIASIEKDDYVIIQYGHNDAKESDPDRYAAPWGEYSENLEYFIKEIRSKGGKPVLATPVSRRWFKKDTLDLCCHGDYPAAMKKVAEKTGTPLLDVLPLTQEWLSALGDEGSKPYYMYDWNPKKMDNTHTKANGARKLASFVAESLRNSSDKALEGLRSHLLDPAAVPEIIVAADGSGDVLTVQEGINAAPDYAHGHITTIYIKPGVYKEEVIIPHNKFRLHIWGDDALTTKITFDKYAREIWDVTGTEVGTSGSATMYIHSSYVTMENITIENTNGDGKDIGQAVALFTDGDFLFFNGCRFIGSQDTLYTYGRYGKDGGVKRNYYLDCYIEGTTDFIFGPSICYFENCRIHSKKNSYITAASTFEGAKYGYVFHNCTLTAEPDITKCYLGRPWGAYAKTVFIDCEMGSHILPEGWHDWEKPGKPDTKANSYYAEYGSKGPGASTKGRVSWSHILSDKEVGEYSFEKVMFQKEDGIVWNPYDNK